MKTFRMALIGAALAAVVPAAVHAQYGALSVEPRYGLAFALGDDQEGLETGTALGINLTYELNSRFLGFAGVSLNRFDADATSFCDDDPECDFTAYDAGVDIQGVQAGVRAMFPMPRVTPYLQAGLSIQSYEVEIDGPGPDFAFKTESEIGFEVGGGLEVPLSPRLSLTPALTYTDIKNAEYVKADVGLRIRL